MCGFRARFDSFRRIWCYRLKLNSRGSCASKQRIVTVLRLQGFFTKHCSNNVFALHQGSDIFRRKGCLIEHWSKSPICFLELPIGSCRMSPLLSCEFWQLHDVLLGTLGYLLLPSLCTPSENLLDSTLSLPTIDPEWQRCTILLAWKMVLKLGRCCRDDQNSRQSCCIRVLLSLYQS